MACAYGEAQPPHELALAWQCTRWNCLPDVGGLHDQDWLLMRRMGAFDGIYKTLVRVQSLEGKRIHELTTTERRTLRWLKDMELWPMRT